MSALSITNDVTLAVPPRSNTPTAPGYRYYRVTLATREASEASKPLRSPECWWAVVAAQSDHGAIVEAVDALRRHLSPRLGRIAPEKPDAYVYDVEELIWWASGYPSLTTTDRLALRETGIAVAGWKDTE